MERLAVLYAEDNPQDIELALRHMRRHAAHISLQTATTAHECLQRLEAEPYDAVLLDYRLPDRDGLELLHEIRERSLPVAVVILTGAGDPETAAAALKDGAYDYLVKQSDYLERLPAVVERAVAMFRAARDARERIRVLYAEHSAADIELTLRHCRLRAPHLEFDVVTSGGEALRRLDAGGYDIVLLDYKMPELDGVALTRAIVERRLPMPAVLITGRGDEQTAVAALKAGAYDYLVKREGYLYRLPSALEHALARYRLAEEKAILERRVAERTREITLANQRVEALAAVAARIQLRLNPAALSQTLSTELKGLGWESLVALADADGQHLNIVHFSRPPEVVASVVARLAPCSLLRLRRDAHPVLAATLAARGARFVDRPREEFVPVLLASMTGGEPVPALVGELFTELGGVTDRTRAVVAPLSTEAGLRGLLIVWGDNLQESDVPAVSAFAGQAAVAIENAGLHEQLRARRLEEQGVLLRLSEELLATLFPQEIMERAAAAAARVLHADFAGVLLPAGEAGGLELRAGIGVGAGSLAGLHLPPGEGSTEGTAFERRCPARSGAPSGQGPEPAQAFSEYGLHSSLAVPLVAGDSALGVLSVQARARRDFDEDDERVVVLIAGQAAVALERARLYLTEQRRAAQLGLIREVGQEIMAVLEPDELLERIVGLVHERFHYAYVAVLLVDSERNELALRARAPVPAIQGGPVRLRIGREGVTGWVAAHAQPLLVNDVNQDDRFVFDSAAPDVSAELAVPIAARGRVLGVLDAMERAAGAFGQEDLFTLQALAQQIAIALENARLYAETRRRAEEVSTLLITAAAAAAPGAVDERLHTIACHARQLVKADGCVIHRLMQYGGEALLLQPLVALDAHDVPVAAEPMRPDEGVQGRVAATRKSEITRIPWQSRVAWAASVPLLAGQETIGVMTLLRHAPERPFVPHDLELLSTLASQAALAIQNAELIETLQARAATLQAAYDRLAEADQLKDHLVQNISHELRTPLTFLKGYVDLLVSGDLGPLAPEQLDGLRIIATKTETIIRLVDDVVTLQALSTAGLYVQLMDVNDLARRVTDVTSLMARRAGLRLRCELHAERALTRADPNRIAQVLDSLLSNAIKFSPDGGDIVLRVAVRDGDVVIEVQDHGVGIPLEKMPRIFERFYQADGSTTRRFGGVGIGLAIVKQIVELHGGKVEVESAPGKGSTFRVRLPAAEE